MALHKDFPESAHAILDPAVRWFPADEALREPSMDKLMPPPVSQLRKKVKEFRDGDRLKQKETALSLQIDVTATPKHDNGAIFVQTVADYPPGRSHKHKRTKPKVLL